MSGGQFEGNITELRDQVQVVVSLVLMVVPILVAPTSVGLSNP